MVKEGRAVVVDYKFGLRQNPDHRRQLGEYIELLREIGYTQVEAICGTCAWNGSCQSTADVFDSLGSSQKKKLPNRFFGNIFDSWISCEELGYTFPLPKKSQRLSTKSILKNII